MMAKQTAQENRQDDFREWCEAVSQDLQQLAVLHDREVDADLIGALREVDFPYNLGFAPVPFEANTTGHILREPSATNDATEAKEAKEANEAANTENQQTVPRELIDPQRYFATALEELPEQIEQQTLDALAVDFADIYLNHGLRASPFESVWLDEDHLLQQEPMFKIREWYKRYGLGIEDWRVRSEDHLVLQLQFIAYLFDSGSSISSSEIEEVNEAEAEANADADETTGMTNNLHQPDQRQRLQDAARFMDEHLLLWLPDFSLRVAQRCGTDFYASAAMLTHAYVEQLRDVLAEITQIARPTAEEIEQALAASKPVVEAPITFMPGVAESW